jgi:hypothetical protein
MSDYQDWYREGSLPLYGLAPSYTGIRMIGDSNRLFVDDHDGRGSRQVAFSLGLAHGDAVSETEPYLQVITAIPPGPEPIELLRAEAARPTSSFDDQGATPVRMPIGLDGEEVEGHGIASGDCWVVTLPRGNFVVSVVGVRWPREHLELVRIEDPEPYIAGRSEFIRRLEAGG